MDRRIANLVCCALVAAASVVVEPARAQQASEPAIADVPAGVTRLLEDLGRAWESGERDLLGATLEPGPFAEARLRAFDNASRIPFDVYRFRATTRYSGDLASPRIRSLYGDREVSVFHVLEESAVAGVEAVPYVDSGFFTFLRGDRGRGDPYDGWRLSSASDLEPLGGFSPVHLWDGGPVTMTTSANLALLVHPDRADRVTDILPLAEEAYAQARRFWPRPVDSRYVIVVPSTTAELGEMIQATVDLDKFVAFAARTAVPGDEYTPAGVRLVLHLQRMDRYDPAGRRSILAHELIHAVTTPVSGPFTPIWVEEGLAMHGSEPSSGLRTARRGRAPDEFPTSDEFFVGSVGDIVRTYARSQVAFEVLEDAKGREALAAFYEALGAVRLAAGVGEYHVREAAAAALGWPLEEWTKSWRDRL